jgi:phospholipid/cholesterol/gamma-HCH transport system substrate-binding protein
MPRTRSLAWSELKIGIVSLFALVIASVLIFMVSGEGGFFWQRYSIKTVFSDIEGLKEGAPVRVAGVEIGSVRKMDFIGDKVEVTVEVSKEQQSRITNRSIASLGSVSLLGEAAVDITANSQGTPIPEWGYVPSGAAPGSLSTAAEAATKSLEQTNAVLEDVRQGRGTLGKLLTDDTLYLQLNDFVQSAEAVTRSINAGRGTLGRLVNDPAAAKSLEQSLGNLEMVTARIRNGEGSLGRLLNDDTLSKSVTSATMNLDAITGRINKGEGTAGKLITDPELYNRLNSMADRLDKLTSALNQGEGTAGQLLHDKQLYENMNGAVTELHNLVKDIRADPKKYLNVRVSIF